MSYSVQKLTIAIAVQLGAILQFFISGHLAEMTGLSLLLGDFKVKNQKK